MRNSLIVGFAVCLAAFSFCGSKENAAPADPAGAAQPADKGIGPIKALALAPVDAKLAEQGKGLFNGKCTVCHGLDKDSAGPALGSILKDRTPEFVMNMLLNTAEMEDKNETIKKLAAQYGMPMPPPGLTHEQARAILEYLRTTVK
jgi:cytochrome c